MHARPGQNRPGGRHRCRIRIIVILARQREAYGEYRAGVVRNTSALLGQDGIVGLKTGSTQAVGGCLLVAAWQRVNGHDILIVAATF